jgi:hypothetical protein
MRRGSTKTEVRDHCRIKVSQYRRTAGSSGLFEISGLL